ncbi:MAG: pilus assembly protein, partial [Bacilli bacterium]|nr:pilus assembly protein [Bacilli bacterium]
MRLNNKGQALVMFVLIIPIILLVLVLIYDIGNALYEKNRMSNTNYLATEYALDNMGSINENDVIRYIQKNADNLNNISVTFNDNEVEIYTERKI